MSIIKQKKTLFMKQTKLVGASLLSAEHPHIAKHTSLQSILLSIAIALVGIVFIYFSLDHDQKSSTLSMTLLTVGAILILVSLYRFFWKSAEMVYTLTGSVVSMGSYYSDTDVLPLLQQLIENKNFDQAARVTFKSSGNGRLDYMISKDGKFAAVQLFRFVPYTYEPVSEIFYYTDADAKAFQNYLETRQH